MSSGNRVKTVAGRVTIFFITDKGRQLAQKLTELYAGAEMRKYSSNFSSHRWKKDNTLIFIMASGIVVRTIAPLVKDKKTDPAVIVMDETGQYVISLLSGHLGGANQKAGEIAGFLGGKAVITTASDLNKIPSIDLWAEENGLVIENWDMLPKVGTRLLNNGSISVFAEAEIDLPDGFIHTKDAETADMIVSDTGVIADRKKRALYLRPKDLVLGIGCNSLTPSQEIESAIRRTLADFKLSFLSVHSIATIEIKKNEPGLILFAEKYGLNLRAFNANELNTVKGVTPSTAAKKATGAQAVAEPAALLASEGGRLIVNKQKLGNVTVAVAEIKRRVRILNKNREKKTGKIFVVGTGPGDVSHITPCAQQAIRGADVIVGYGTYIDLIKDLIMDKEVFSTGMTQEIDRCRKAVELAGAGRTVAVISGGDPGIYAMAGLVLELLRNQKSESGIQNPELEIIPGISALNAAAARLGAPLMHDFASISLSDRLTPWETIEKRLEAAAMADFVIVLYNPRSKGRTEQIGRAREIIMKHRSADTPVGIVRGAMRENEAVVISDLGRMLEAEIDMQTSVIIGNSNTSVWNNMMITPRGYEKKKQFTKR